ncbi:intraflagellar transport protein 20 [Cladochytrium replicatum]|nr:intraflagellar transport protein 20 [Cladochytrium replicatum]
MNTKSPTRTTDLISFDEFSKIRILEPAHFEASENLKEECREFTNKLNEFHGIIQSLLQILLEKSKQIEREKLKAIGYRNKVENEVDKRKARAAQLSWIIKEKQAELDRLNLQAESLERVRLDQMSMIENLSGKQ